eukprot:CAMPEP_0119060510 /NCGR_PEP_ID=MMETSP1178-20130426/4448_1 /TAXON_ID=33656 /ORGANISM="unid sp, Strain CCMP2000" /LENGTH=58 /DNA_ID=CAMNT_0007041611 /DNA_START=1 /DNA_END=177 /DNA_ORIENTATION=-
MQQPMPAGGPFGPFGAQPQANPFAATGAGGGALPPQANPFAATGAQGGAGFGQPSPFS